MGDCCNLDGEYSAVIRLHMRCIGGDGFWTVSELSLESRCHVQAISQNLNESYFEPKIESALWRTRVLDKAITVQGPVLPEELGITLPHEHVLMNVDSVEPLEASKQIIYHQPITIENLCERGWAVNKRGDAGIKDLSMIDPDEARQELMKYKAVGGKSLVEVTCMPEMGRDPESLREISVLTGLNILCGTGWYTEQRHLAYVKKKTADELAEIMVKELKVGIGSTGIRAGVIGEIGFSEPVAPNETKVLHAVCKAQVETGAPVCVHPGLLDAQKHEGARKVETYLDVLQETVDLSKVYVSHMDCTSVKLAYGIVMGIDLDYCRKILDGYEVTACFDTFGSNCDNRYGSESSGDFPGWAWPTDSWRISVIAELVKSGYERQLFISQDICAKTHWTKYGGYGYAYNLRFTVPALRYAGLTEKQVNTILVDNPKRMLTWPID